MSESVQIIRVNQRNAIKFKRSLVKAVEINTRRNLSKSNQNSKEVVFSIASKLKKKSQISVEELSQLKNALIDAQDNITCFISTAGALHGLVREMTGHDAAKQLQAISCCCNLCLGDTKNTSNVVKAISSYLITLFNSLNKELLITVIWAIGNIAGSNINTCTVLKSQGFIEKLYNTLINSQDKGLANATQYALIHFSFTMGNNLELNDASLIIDALLQCKIKSNYTYQLLYILSCHRCFHACVLDVNAIITHLLKMPSPDASQHNAIYLSHTECAIRTLANICSMPKGCEIFLSITNLDNNLPWFFTIEKSNIHKNVNLLWLLANIHKLAVKTPEKINFFNKVECYIKTILISDTKN